MKKLSLYFVALLAISVVGCKKDYLETRPSNAVTEQQIFSDLNSVYSALEGVNKELFAYGIGSSTGHDNFSQKGYDLASDLMGNDMIVHTQGYGWFNSDYNLSEWSRAVTGSRSDNAWYLYYDIIKQTNQLLANIDGVNNTTQDQKNLVKGQALGLRAYAYFYLINYFQQTYKGNETKPGVPIYTEVSVEGKARGTVQEVYTQIVADLTEAEALLTGKVRAAKSNVDVSVVQGFRARTALLMEDWATAATYANKAKTGYTLMTAAQYVTPQAFSSIANPEWMWGATIPADQATIYASFFSHMDIRTGGYASLGNQKKITKALYDQIPTDDVRKKVFRDPNAVVSNPANVPYNQVKHQVPTSGSWAADYLFMRAAEMYLIEAEGLARQANDNQSRTVLETLIKTRYPAYSAAGLSGAGLVNEILLQRRIELWGEGFSLMDIKRLNQGLNRPTGAGNHGSPSFDPGVYTTAPADPRFIMRVPQRELDNNSNMTPTDQNP